MSPRLLRSRAFSWGEFALASDAGEAVDSLGLSPRLQEQLRRRLGLFCLVLVGAVVILAGADWYLTGDVAESASARAKFVSQVALTALALVTFAATRHNDCSGRKLLGLTSAFVVLGALLVSAPGFWGDHGLQRDLAHLPWAGLWLALVPLVVPLPLGQAALTAFLGAAAPLTLHLAWHTTTGQPLCPDRLLVANFLPVAVAAAMGLVPGQILFGLGRRLSAAEEQAQRLGSYELVELLGKGGMGEVWRAEHALLARPAAVKIVAPEVLSADRVDPDERETALRRFEREARATAALRSPHTIALYDFGVAPDGRLYYVMELLDGSDLETLVQRCGPVPPGRAIHLLLQACCSLAEAHEAGLIHRDVKPANLYACRLGTSYDFVKVLDFGLVGRDSAARAEEAVKLTADGYLVGTPAFLPPEMATGDELDGRADVYSLGCVAYWLLTGQYVFPEESPLKMIVAHAQSPAERPSARLGRRVPGDLETVVMACLAKDPDERPSSMHELAARLERCQDAGTWSRADARRWWREHGERLRAKPDPEPPAEALSEDALGGATSDPAKASTETVARPRELADPP